MGELELRDDLRKLKQFEPWWEEIFNAHVVNDGTKCDEMYPFLSKVFETDGITCTVTLDTRDDRLRTVSIEFGGTKMTTTVTRTALVKWLGDMREMASRCEDGNAAEIVNQIHEMGLARRVFMDLFRHSNQLKESMTAEKFSWVCYSEKMICRVGCLMSCAVSTVQH